VYGDSHASLELPCPVMFTESEGTFTLSGDQRAGVAGSAGSHRAGACGQRRRRGKRVRGQPSFARTAL